MSLSDEEQILLSKIRDEATKLRQIETALKNNAVLPDFSDSIQKALVENNSLSQALQDKQLVDCSVVKLDPAGDLQDDLRNELEGVHEHFSKLSKVINDDHNRTNKLNSYAEDIQSRLEASNDALCNDLLKKLDVIEKNIKMCFLKEKKELKAIITTLFPERLDIQDLIAEITEHHFTEGADKYMKLENLENIEDQVELLLKTGLFELNPHDRSEIRLIEME